MQQDEKLILYQNEDVALFLDHTGHKMKLPLSATILGV